MVKAPFQVRLLGRPASRAGDGEWSDLKPGFTSALLGYLAFEARWVERGELAALFWPDRSEEAARSNLRPLLWRLAHEPLPAALERERTRVRWPVRTDHAAFLHAFRAERWKDAWELGGELLAGVRLPGAPEFGAWLELERAAVHRAVRTAGMRSADEAARSGDDAAAADVLSALYRSDAYDEAVLRALIGALDRRGSRAQARAILAEFERLCREELDAEPEPATSALAATLEGGPTQVKPRTPSEALDPAGGVAARRGAEVLPAPLTPFIGRSELVAAVSTAIAASACRVLTLVGPGGVGKTRIAIEVARTVGGRFEAGARFVDLVAVSNESAVVAAVAGATGVDLAGGEDPKQRVLRALASRHVLLVLDNAEHIDEASALVAELVLRAPRLTVLVTSRRSTGLAAECVVDVGGLAHRQDVGRRRRSRPGPAGTWRPTEAAELFLQVARRAGGALDGADGTTIERLCARLGGVPLAIELAAAWTRALDLGQIEAELANGLEILSGEAPDRPSRHASMRAVFEHSWATLHARERATMRRLAPFRGGFSLDAAREAASIALPVLLALTNKSFLRRSGDGRFTRHPLVWQYAWERAAECPDELQASGDRHAAYFLGFLAERNAAFQHADGERMMLEIDADLENVRAAWRWACTREQRALLRSAVSSLGGYCFAWGRFDLQDELLPPAIEIASDDALLLGLLLLEQGLARMWQAVADFGASLFAQALPLLESAAGPSELALALRGHAMAHARLGHREAADASYVRAASLYEQVGDVQGVLMMAVSRAGLVDTASEASARFAACVGEARAAGTSHSLGMALAGRAGALLLLGEFAAAEASVRDAQREQRGARTPIWSLDRRNLRALVCIDRGRLPVARALCCRTLAGRGRSASEVDALGDAATVAMAALARVAYLVEDAGSAQTWARRALEHHKGRHGPAASYDPALVTLVRTALLAGDLGAAHRWTEEFGRGPDPRWYSGPLTGGATTVATLVCRAELALAAGDDEAAAAAVHAAVTLARRKELLAAGLGALVAAARILDRRGARSRARRIAAFLADHPRASFETRRAAARSSGAERAPQPSARDEGTEAVLDAFDRVLAELRGRSAHAPTGLPRTRSRR